MYDEKREREKNILGVIRGSQRRKKPKQSAFNHAFLVRRWRSITQYDFMNFIRNRNSNKMSLEILFFEFRLFRINNFLVLTKCKKKRKN